MTKPETSKSSLWFDEFKDSPFGANLQETQCPPSVVFLFICRKLKAFWYFERARFNMDGGKYSEEKYGLKKEGRYSEIA